MSPVFFVGRKLEEGSYVAFENSSFPFRVQHVRHEQFTRATQPNHFGGDHLDNGIVELWKEDLVYVGVPHGLFLLRNEGQINACSGMLFIFMIRGFWASL